MADPPPDQNSVPELGPFSVPGEPESYAFLSYASRDHARAIAVADALEAAGVRIWVDRRGIAGGAAWAGAIAAAIRACGALVVLCSAASLASRNVRQELQLAWDRDRPILPLLLEPVEFPDAVAYFLQGRQWVRVLDRPEVAWVAEVVAALPALAAPSGPTERPVLPDHAAQPPTGSPSPPLAEAAGNLPTPPTSIVGRERELAVLASTLRRDDARLVTLTGPGGVGKTRLALEAAKLAELAFPDGVWFADLAPVNDPALVVPTIARALEVREAGERPLRDHLVAFLRGKRLLLVLDNFEQVAPAGPAVADLLASAPGLRVLATSRAPLQLRGEREVAVAPLALPADASLGSVRALALVPAVALFAERAAAAKAGFAVTGENAAAVAEICRRLDGLPLAIELAAARVRMLPPAALLARLDDRLKVLAGGALDLPERQRTMRDAIAWSHDLLGSDEQPLFRRLAVFVGGFDLDAAEAVVGTRSTAEVELDVLDGLARLAGQSLLRQEETADGEPRFALLATIRQFALERLAASGEADEAHGRHAAYFLALVERAEPELTGPEQRPWLQRLDAAHDDLRAALGWTTEHDPESALRLGGALFRFWYVRGYLSEGRTWLRQMLARAGGVSTAVRAKALDTASHLAWAQGDLVRARELGEESLARYREVEDRRGIANALNALGVAAADSGDYARAEVIYAEELALRRELDDPRGLGVVLSNLADSALFQNDYAGAAARNEEALAVLRGTGDEAMVAWVTRDLGVAAAQTGDIARARACFAEALEATRSLGDRRVLAMVFGGLADLAAKRGRPERAARLLGGETALREAIGLPAEIKDAERAWHARIVATVRAALGEAAFAAARQAGSGLALEDLVAEARAESEETGTG